MLLRLKILFMKDLKKLGQTLSREEQIIINGGLGGPRCVPVDGFCRPQTRENGELRDRDGKFIACCYVAIPAH